MTRRERLDELMPYQDLQALAVELRERLIRLEAEVHFLKRDLGIVKQRVPGPPREQGKLL